MKPSVCLDFIDKDILTRGDTMLVKLNLCPSCTEKLRKIALEQGEDAMSSACGPILQACASCRAQLPASELTFVTRKKPLSPGPFELEYPMQRRCPCGVTVKFGFVHGRPTVIHRYPVCATFERFESPLEYARFLDGEQGNN